MLQYQVDSMRTSINRLLLRIVPPKSVGILKDHAKYLGVPYQASTPVSEPGLSKRVPRGVNHGSVVMVKLEHLYLALRAAKGVDSKERPGSNPTGDIEATNATDDQATQKVED